MRLKKISLLQIAYMFFAISFILLVWYIVNLFISGYINIYRPFDLETSSKISPFLGSFIAPLIGLATTILLLDNLLEFKRDNKKTDEKFEKKITLKHCQMFLVEIQLDLKRLSDKGIHSVVAMGLSNKCSSGG
jgi:hypothetical protein